MSHAITTTRSKKRYALALLSGSLVFLTLLLAACGGAVGMPSGATSTGSLNALPPAAATPGASNPGKSGTSIVGQYLIKSLAVNMAVKDTRRVAADLQAWISTTDPRSTSAGIDYEQTGDNLYNVTMQFSVQATMYTQIKLYLEDYTSQRRGQLISLHETVQDVTNDFIDSQSADFFATLSQAVGAKLDGIIGYNFLRNFRVVMDYPSEKFRLE